MDWLLAPIDPTRAHEVGFAISWHARSMVLAWGVLAPLAVIIARFFKVMPRQDWPRELDNQVWWRSHWMGQSLVVGLSIFGLALVLPSDLATMSLHNWLGYLVLVGALLQVVLGLCRGSKGGPTDTQLRGHHYDMTPWRRMFEALHKIIGYAVILLAILTITLGLWKANGPVWMWLVLAIWWTTLLAVFVMMQKRGMAVDTYQAIWGTDPHHPGNQGPAPGWGVRRLGETEEGRDDVRRHRGDRVRSH
ncbi:cytochrome b561 domain-containing protein [uncultured Tateyamaria sp.]|uniref:cytochrome b561 domain-containing protein n=1 Tax=uncultured Tateyamaria sp. TaxID=455651 RepID=UPI0026157759|nr:cytochrome b561 domain-containing protein [uncultured Tateyamaria sp.]